MSQRQHGTGVTPGGDRRSVTATVEMPDGTVHSLVDWNQARLAAAILRRWGRPLRLLSLSDPASIWADLNNEPHPPHLRPELRAVFLDEPQQFGGFKLRWAVRKRVQAAARRLGL